MKYLLALLLLSACGKAPEINSSFGLNEPDYMKGPSFLMCGETFFLYRGIIVDWQGYGMLNGVYTDYYNYENCSYTICIGKVLPGVEACQ